MKRRRFFTRLGSSFHLENRIAPAAQMLPDLIVLENYLSGWTINNVSGGGREIRFSTGIANIGQGAFELNGAPIYIFNPDGTQSQVVNQKIFWDDGTNSTRQAGTFTYHPEHGHVHFDDMAVARLRSRTGTTIGPVVAEGPKTSFCLLDITRNNPGLPGSPASSKYNQCNSQTQGISVGWADVYGSTLEGQSINLTGVPNGDYWLEVEFDPLNSILEVNESNNIARIAITITTLPTVGFRILDATPLGANNDPASKVTFNFNQEVDPATFTTADVTFKGPDGAIPITSVTTTDNVTFDVNFPTQTKVGTFQMDIGPNITSKSGKLLDQNNNGVTMEAADGWINIFTITPPQVLSTSPAGGVAAPLSSVRVSFNKPMLSSSFTAADIVSFDGPGGSLLASVTGVTPLSPGATSTIFDINFASVSAVGNYTMVINTDITDPMGNTIDQNGDGFTTIADRKTVNISITPAGLAGPDAFGYTGQATTSPSGSIMSKAGRFTISNNADDASNPVNFGTAKFNYYGVTHTGNSAIHVSTNGLVTFGASNNTWQNGDMTSVSTPALAPLWDDWYFTESAPQVVGLFEDLNGDTVADRLILEWNQVEHRDFQSGSGVTFQVILELNTGNRPGNIVYNYLDLDTGSNSFTNGASATVGWKAATGGSRTVISQNSGSNALVASGKAILISVPHVQSITRMDASPNDHGEVEYLVTFSEGVTGVTKETFTLALGGGVVGGMVDHIHGTANPAVYEVHVKGYVGTGTLRVDLDDTDTIQSLFGAKLGGAGTGNGNFTAGEVYQIVQAPPTVFGTTTGDGTAQRSRVNSVKVIFDRTVVFSPDMNSAFTLKNAQGVDVPFTTSILPDPVQTNVIITPAGGGSFADGRYTLTALSSKISTGGVAFDGDDNGTAGGDFSMQFHRLYGDVDGDATVTVNDFLAFRLAFLSNNAALDFDNDGEVGASDFLVFRINFLKTV